MTSEPMTRDGYVPALHAAAPIPASARCEEQPVHDEIAGNVAMSPAVNAALVVDVFHPVKGSASITALADKIERTAAAIRAGDLADIEELLMAQAQALGSIFTQYALRSAGAVTQDRATELLLVAIKAQAASRATLATLVDLKLPRQTVIARQANLAAGPQQVNNHPAPGTPPQLPEGPSVVPVASAAPQGQTLQVRAASRVRARKAADRTIPEGRR